jgi:hypothetical protein
LASEDVQDHAKGKHENKNGTDAINAVSVCMQIQPVETPHE